MDHIPRYTLRKITTLSYFFKENRKKIPFAFDWSTRFVINSYWLLYHHEK